GWHARLAAGAWRIEGLADDSTRLLHRAGAPLELAWRGPGRRLLPPTFIQPGEELRLTGTPAQPSPRDHRRSAPAWSHALPVRWPFGASRVSESAESAPKHASELLDAFSPRAESTSGLLDTAAAVEPPPTAPTQSTPIEPSETLSAIGTDGDAAPLHPTEPLL